MPSQSIDHRVPLLLPTAIALCVLATAALMLLFLTRSRPQVSSVHLSIALAPGEHLQRTRRQWVVGTVFSVLSAIWGALGGVLSRKAYAVMHAAGEHLDGGNAAYQRCLGGLLVGGICLLVAKRHALRIQSKATHEMIVEASRRKWRGVWPWVLAGIAVGAGIHGYVPEGLLAGFMGKSAWWSVPAAVAIGVPMYSNAAGIIPVVEALLGKGAALGTVLAFMMAVIGLSLPEIVILRKVLRPRLIAAFVGIVASGILLVGWLFNAVL